MLFPKHILPIYSLPIVMLGLSIGEIFYPHTLYSFNGTFVLSVVCVNMLFVLFMLGKAYVKIRKSQIVVLFVCVVAPFIPFVLLFALPQTLVGEYIMSSEIAALFFWTNTIFNFIYSSARAVISSRLPYFEASLLFILCNVNDSLVHRGILRCSNDINS